jgi:hypothetical protein
MSDFKQFLDKVLLPLQGEAGAGQGEAAAGQGAAAAAGAATAGAGSSQITLPPPAQPAAADPVPAAELERRYVAVMNALFTDALERNSPEVFTDIVAWKLATVAYHFGPFATGDIVRKLGAHLETIARAEKAQQEADAAKKEGRRPN